MFTLDVAIAPVKGVFASLTPIVALGSGMRFAYLDAWTVAGGVASRKAAEMACVRRGKPVPTVLGIAVPASHRVDPFLPSDVVRDWPWYVAREEHSPSKTA